MAVQFAVLASGSRGNSTLIQAGGSGILLDIGLGPRKVADRLRSVGSDWDRIALALLTHTHGDHVDSDTLGLMAGKGIALYCHEGHHKALSRLAEFRALKAKHLVKTFEDRPFLLPNGLRAEAFPLPHGVGPTFGFRVEARPQKGSRWVAIGYLADLGHWTEAMVEAVADVDLLGVEFNHDVGMQWGSGRPPSLIARNVGKQGHLSNEQGADFLAAAGPPAWPGNGGPKRVVLLHMSEHATGLEPGRSRRRGRPPSGEGLGPAGRDPPDEPRGSLAEPPPGSLAPPGRSVGPARVRVDGPQADRLPLGTGLSGASLPRQRRPPPARPARSGRPVRRVRRPALAGGRADRRRRPLRLLVRQPPGRPRALADCEGLRALADFRSRGGSLTILPGNHDGWLGPYYREHLGAAWSEGPIRREVCGPPTWWPSHGHRLGARSAWKGLMEGRAFLGAFGITPRPIAEALERRLDRSNDRHRVASEERHLALFRRRARRLPGGRGGPGRLRPRPPAGGRSGVEAAVDRPGGLVRRVELSSGGRGGGLSGCGQSPVGWAERGEPHQVRAISRSLDRS